MKDNIHTKIVRVCDYVLCDDHGVSESAYMGIINLLATVLDESELSGVIRCIDATDGRFYFTDNFSIENYLRQGK